jgi:hypothetical protein
MTTDKVDLDQDVPSRCSKLSLGQLDREKCKLAQYSIMLESEAGETVGEAVQIISDYSKSPVWNSQDGPLFREFL